MGGRFCSVRVRMIDGVGVGGGSGRGPTRSDATLCAHDGGEAGVFVSLRAIVGRRCVPIGRARRHRSEPSSLEKSRIEIVRAGIHESAQGLVDAIEAMIGARTSDDIAFIVLKRQVPNR